MTITYADRVIADLEERDEFAALALLDDSEVAA